MARAAKTELQKWTLWFYYLLPDDNGGKYVNDRQETDTFEFRVPKGGTPSDRQLSRVVGLRGLEWHGDDSVIYGDDKNGDPVCEFVREED